MKLVAVSHNRIFCGCGSYDYSGYGMSTGRPSEKNMYADIEAAWLALRSRYSIDPGNIVLYGQSIGTVPTVHLATRYQVAAVVLHSPLMSGMRVAFPRARRTCCLDVFKRLVYSSIYAICLFCKTVFFINSLRYCFADFNNCFL